MKETNVCIFETREFKHSEPCFDKIDVQNRVAVLPGPQEPCNNGYITRRYDSHNNAQSFPCIKFGHWSS